MRQLPVADYENLYLVGDDGSVFSLKNKIFLRQHCCGKSKYLSVVLTKMGKQKRFSVHRLVAKAFLHPVGEVVNHKDGLKFNNSASNLEWTSHSGNASHAWNTGLMENARRSLIENMTGRPSPKKGKKYANIDNSGRK